MTCRIMAICIRESLIQILAPCSAYHRVELWHEMGHDLMYSSVGHWPKRMKTSKEQRG